MKTLTRHLLYLATFLALLLVVVGLMLFREAPVAEVLAGATTLIAIMAGMGWIGYLLNAPPTRSRHDSVYDDEKASPSAF